MPRHIGAPVRLQAAALAVILLAGVTNADDIRWQARSGLALYEGDYGTDEASTTLCALFSLKRYFTGWDLAGTLPFVSVDEEGDSSLGLGDITVKGRYYLLKQSGLRPAFDVTGKLKLPTAASGDEGLGTGEADVGVGTECLYVLPSGLLLLGDAEVTIIGDPADINYDNRIMLDAGLGYRMGRTFGCVYIEYRSAIDPTGKDSVSSLLAADHRLAQNLKADGMIEIGLSEGAADFGLSVGLRYYF